jgi:hypothetical protein
MSGPMLRSTLKAQPTLSRNIFSTSAPTIRHLLKERITSCTLRFQPVGTNVFGEDLQQMIDHLKGVWSKVSVFKLVLQCVNTQLINWISTSHKNLDDLTWLTAWVAQKCIALKAGTCRNTINIDRICFLIMMFYRWVSSGALFTMDIQKWTMKKLGLSHFMWFILLQRRRTAP